MIAKSRYLPCIHFQNQNAVAYGCQAATKNLRQSKKEGKDHFKVTELQNLTLYAKTKFKTISVFKSKRVNKIKSGNFMFLSRFISSMGRL